MRDGGGQGCGFDKNGGIVAVFSVVREVELDNEAKLESDEDAIDRFLTAASRDD